MRMEDDSSPNSQVHQHLALLFRTPGPPAKDIFQRHLTINPEAICDSADTIRTESSSTTYISEISPMVRRSSLSIDISYLSASATLVFGQLSRDAESMTKLSLLRRQRP
jgi:hypothetical protein